MSYGGDEFYITMRESARGNFGELGLGIETPSTKSPAVQHIRDARLSLGDDVEFRVVWCEADTARFTDVTLSVVGKADELDAAEAACAAEQARHVEQETHSWEVAR